MNQYQAQLSGLETFVSNLNSLYIELIVDNAVKSHNIKELKVKIDEALIHNDKEAFFNYTNELKALAEL